MALNIVIMAAGKGTRMKSALPKVLHRIAGRSLLQHVLDAAAGLRAQQTLIITGHGAEQVEAAAAASGARFVRQMPQHGTGHAVQQVVPVLDGRQPTTLILSGDVPLLRTTTAQALVTACAGQRLALLTVVPQDATGYGRILREVSPGGSPHDSGDGSAEVSGNVAREVSRVVSREVSGKVSRDNQARVLGIVEHKDATAAQRKLGEIYTGIMAAPTALLARWVMALSNHNAQKEYYLTDIVAMAVAEGVPVVTTEAASENEVLGVNDPEQLALLERAYQRGQAQALMREGVRLADPARLEVRGTLACGSDVEIDIDCIFEGQVRLGDGVRVGAHCVIRDAQIEAGAVIHPFCHIEGARVGTGALVGPFARLRPGAELGAEVHIGNFVEVKNSSLAAGAKANHLAYLGDATVGERVNFGAGSITANYDGANKHRTVIGADVHVGSNCVLVAPVVIGAGATIGGGSTVSKDVPPGKLTVARAKQVSLEGWQRPRKKKA